MKKLPFLQSALAILCFGLMLTSCSIDFGDEDTVDSFDYIEQPGIYDIRFDTSVPDTSSDPVEFRGAIIRNDESIEVAYGFMWYDPNDPVSASNPTRIEVGRTRGTTVFTADAIGIPTERELIVCTFIATPTENSPESVVGNEVPFTAPDPEK